MLILIKVDSYIIKKIEKTNILISLIKYLKIQPKVKMTTLPTAPVEANNVRAAKFLTGLEVRLTQPLILAAQALLLVLQGRICELELEGHRLQRAGAELKRRELELKAMPDDSDKEIQMDLLCDKQSEHNIKQTMHRGELQPVQTEVAKIENILVRVESAATGVKKLVLQLVVEGDIVEERRRNRMVLKLQTVSEAKFPDLLRKQILDKEARDLQKNKELFEKQLLKAETKFSNFLSFLF